jgi:hypothetical protein
MDTRRVRLLRLLAALIAGTICLPALSGMLYKSVGDNGTVVFSDVPPPKGTPILEQRRMPESAPASPGPKGTAGLPVYEFPEYDAALARANEQVDLAEHALAVARQGLWSPRDGLRLASARMTPDDENRIEFFRKGVKIARQQLVDLLRERQSASASRYVLASR